MRSENHIVHRGQTWVSAGYISCAQVDLSLMNLALIFTFDFASCLKMSCENKDFLIYFLTPDSNNNPILTGEICPHIKIQSFPCITSTWLSLLFEVSPFDVRLPFVYVHVAPPAVGSVSWLTTQLASWFSGCASELIFLMSLWVGGNLYICVWFTHVK